VRYTFDWDPEKAQGNIRKHGIYFDRAATVFLDPRALTIYDKEHSGHEDRWITMGIDRNGIVLVVVHTFEQTDDRTALIRIISARKATNNERKHYDT
jgi:uncharacterized DUF497 family protein